MNDLSDFRDILFLELERRKKETPGYSLRRFAKFLSTDPSFLTKLFQKKRNLTPSVLKRFGKRLGYDEDAITELNMTLFKLDGRKQAKSKRTGSSLKRNKLSAEGALPILHGHCFIILELLTIEDFVCTPKNLALALNTNSNQISSALGHLEKMGLIEYSADGTILSKQVNVAVMNRSSKQAEELSRLFIQFQMKAISSIAKGPSPITSHTGLFIAIPSQRVAEAKKMIEKFRDRFESLVQRPGKRDSVFYFSTGFFPLISAEQLKKL